jgi:hypothetical protein
MIIISARKGELFNPPELPDDDSKIVEVSEEEAKLESIMYFSSACWRQYVGEWKIRYNRLYLSKLKGLWNLANNEPLFADWYSGVLRSGFRKRGYEWEGFHNHCFQKQIFLKIEKGLVLNRKEFPSITSSTLDSPNDDLFYIESGEYDRLFK